MKKTKYTRVIAMTLGCLIAAIIYDLLTGTKLYIELILFGFLTSLLYNLLKNKYTSK